jgi:acetyl esterase/lipase
MVYGMKRAVVGCVLAALLGGCAAGPRANVALYLAREALGPPPAAAAAPGTLEGAATAGGRAQAGVTVIVAEPDGTPHAAQTDEAGRYRIEGVPPGVYVAAAVAPGYDETTARGMVGLPAPIRVASAATTTVPALALAAHTPAPLPPEPLAASVALTRTAAYSATAAYPPGAEAQVEAWRFTHAGADVDSLRTFLPRQVEPAALAPLLFIVYPSAVDGWQEVSVAFASAGFPAVAVSPVEARGVEIDAHVQDARVALHLAQEGVLGTQFAGRPVVVLGGSFSSPILHRLLRDEGGQVAGAVVVGGVADAFRGTQAFYAGQLELPPQHSLVIPALGLPNLNPEPFLRYSPIYTAAQLPRTLIIHTAADRVIPIEQARALEQAARAAGVPVETYYYEDESHYLQIGPQMTEAGIEMFGRILDFLGQTR